MARLTFINSGGGSRKVTTIGSGAPRSATFNAGSNTTFKDIPQEVKGAWVTSEKLAMLATARRNRLGDAGWATLTGIIASLPSTIHDLIEAYWQKNPTGLSELRLIDVGVTAMFIGLFVMSLLSERGDRAKDILHEILNPAQPKPASFWKFWKG